MKLLNLALAGAAAGTLTDPVAIGGSHKQSVESSPSDAHVPSCTGSLIGIRDIHHSHCSPVVPVTLSVRPAANRRHARLLTIRSFPLAEFFPILGDLCVKCLRGELSEEQRSYWSYSGCPDRIDKSRGDSVLIHQVLDPIPSRRSKL